jgi:glycosyltransferase involved in cell wall biosynthesis
MKILFRDVVTPKPYDVDSLLTGRMGGTEATVARIVRELDSRKFEVYLSHRFNEITCNNPDLVITLRDAKEFRVMKDKYPEARHYLWMHDVVSGEYAEHMKQCLSDGGVHELIAVSQWHKNQILNALPELSIKGVLKVTVIYNPVESYCTRRTEYSPHKLIFISSPHKGLDQALDIFQALRTLYADYTLYVANPGYYEDKKDLPEGVIDLTVRNLSHKELMDEVGSSLCLFYPQSVFPETFGIVYAEANALGVPVIAHDIGAAREVLDGQSQVINCKYVDNVVKTVLEWSKGERPTVNGRKEFRLSEVTKDWVKLIRFSNTGRS